MIKAYEQFVGASVFKEASEATQEKQLAIFALGLTGESGEVAELVKKLFDRDRPITQDEIKLELGDVLWYLTALSLQFGLSLADVAAANIVKLEARRKAKAAKAA
jgi:NTP pyrophosphatase (non-canonical NTP hydrolase)